MNEDNKNDDWGMTMPHQRLDDETREVIDELAPKAAEPKAADWEIDSGSAADYGQTAPNINLEPLGGGSDDWGSADTRTTSEDRRDDWKMPDPVFRISAGETPNFERRQRMDDDEDFSEGFESSERAPEENQDREPLPPKPAAAPKKSGNAKWILLLVGIVVVLLLCTAAAAAAYFLWFNQTSSVSSIPANKTETFPESTSNTAPTPASTPAPTPASAELPKSISYKGEMLLVAAGEFTFGSDTGGDESKPAHKVSVDAFYVDKFEVTNAQYKEFCDATGRKYPTNQNWDETYFSAHPNSPVVGVTFDDAKAFAEWAGKRLPTEMEWEKAASWDEKGKAKFQYPWGNDYVASKAATGIAEPVEVGSRQGDVSPYGVFDLAGNAAEWVESYFQPYPNNSKANPNFGETNRVVRGGHFGTKDPEKLTTTNRTFVPPGFRGDSDRSSPIGFRCAVAVNDPKLKGVLK